MFTNRGSRSSSVARDHTPGFRFSCVVVLVVLGLLLAACGGNGASNDTGGGSGGGDQATEDLSDFRVALLAPGTKNNKSWANAWWNGAQRAADDLGLTVEFVGPLDNPDQYLQQGTAFASQGFDLVIMANGAMHDPAVEVATQFPDVQVCQAPYHPADESELQDVPENVCFVDAEQQDSTFLAGMLAGLVTKTNRVASVNGFAFPALTRQPEAFSLGARCVNDGVEFAQRYINSWDDPALAKAAASSLIAGGADVILGATDQAVLGIYEAAREADSQVWVIPSYFDDYESAPEVVLTSALHGLQEVSRRLITSAARGEIEPRSFTDFNVENTPSIDIAPLYANEQKVGQAALDDFQRYVEQTRSGEIEIPDETVGATPIGTEGAAEKIDPASLNCEPVK